MAGLSQSVRCLISFYRSGSIIHEERDLLERRWLRHSDDLSHAGTLDPEHFKWLSRIFGQIRLEPISNMRTMVCFVAKTEIGSLSI